MVLSGQKTELMCRRLKQFYGIRTLVTATAWRKRLKQCGFTKVEVKEHSRSMEKWGVDHDPHREIDMNWFEDERMQRMSQTNDRLLAKYGKKLGYAVLKQGHRWRSKRKNRKKATHTIVWVAFGLFRQNVLQHIVVDNPPVVFEQGFQLALILGSKST